MSEHLTRAHLLIQQGRWDMAERELRGALADDSEDAEAHYLLALCLLERKDYDGAEEEAKAAIHLAPDDPMAHYVLGHTLHERRRYAEAIVALEESLRINPYAVPSFAMLSHIAIAEKRWQDALQSAERGLAIEPDDIDCTNFRAIALVNLGRRPEAGMTIDAALARDPEVSMTHANQGWALLHEGKPQEAMVHFRESLRIDPTQEWARAGIVEALKAKNFIYRWLLRYFLFMSRLSAKTQWILFLLVLFGRNFAGKMANENPALAPYIYPLLYAYTAFVLLSWLGSPLFNLLLFTDKFGRQALSREEKTCALLVGGLLTTSLLCLIVYRVFDVQLMFLTAIQFFLVALPTAGVFVCPHGWPRWTMLSAVLILGTLIFVPWIVVGLVVAQRLTLAVGQAAIESSSDYFFNGFFISQFAIMFLGNVTVRR